jgi:hypothetical protein
VNEPRKPQLSYVHLNNGKVTVTCTCGWRDPLGPVNPSPFDPVEAFVAAQAEHRVCLTQPKNITEQTTMAELSAQRDLLGVTALMLFTNLDGTRTALAQHRVHNSFLGQGPTEAAAIEAAFAQLRRATLPEPLRAMLEAPLVCLTCKQTVPVLDADGQCTGCNGTEADDYDRATGDLGRPLLETKK